MEGGRRHVLQKRVGTTDPEWRLTAKGKLRFREQNEWEVMIPAVLHRKDKKTGRWSTSRDMVVITDRDLTQHSVRTEDFLQTEPGLRHSWSSHIPMQ